MTVFAGSSEGFINWTDSLNVVDVDSDLVQIDAPKFRVTIPEPAKRNNDDCHIDTGDFYALGARKATSNYSEYVAAVAFFR